MSMSDEQSYHITNLNNAVVYMDSYVLILFYILGMIGNLISFLIFMKKSWRKNVCVLYFKVSLFLSTCYLNSTILGAITNFGFNIYLQNSSAVLCKLLYYTSFLLTTLQPTILILASIDRLLISSQKVDTRLYSSKRLAYFSISISTCFWIIFNIHALIKIDIYEIYPGYFSCGFNFPKSYYNFVTYTLGVINVVYCLLMIGLCIFAFKNVRRIRTIPREKRHQQIRTMNKKDFQLLRCLYVQDVIYITFSMLVIIYYIYAAMTQDQTRTPLDLAILNFVDKFVTFLFNISYSTNFFVYLFVSKAFRHELKRTMYKLVGKELHPIREEENRQENLAKVDEDLHAAAVSTIVLPV